MPQNKSTLICKTPGCGWRKKFVNDSSAIAFRNRTGRCPRCNTLGSLVKAASRVVKDSLPPVSDVATAKTAKAKKSKRK